MEEFWKAALPALVEYGVPLAGTIVTTLISLALNAVRKHFNHAAADRALERLERVVNIAVQEVEQTIAPAIREAAADGKITEDEAIGLRLAAAHRAKAILGTKGVKELKASAGDLEEILRSVIEAKVRQMRISMPPPPAD